MRRTLQLTAMLLATGWLFLSCGGDAITAPATGDLEIKTVTSGSAPDPDGYGITLDGGGPNSIASAGQLTIQVSPGAYELTITGVASNCQLQGDNPRSVSVEAGETTNVDLSVSCSGPQGFRIAWLRGNIRILAVEDPPPEEPKFDIYVMNADGSGQRNLTNNPGALQGPTPWSPGGRMIAFTSNRSGNNEVYVVEISGGAQTQLTHNPADDAVAEWSPDGSKLLFLSTRDGRTEIYSMSADGSEQTRLTHSALSTSIGEPHWSPNGRQVLYWKDFDFYLMNSDGSGQRNITNNRRRRGSASWSPDGSRIAFAGSPDAAELLLDIFVIRADGSGLTRLTDDLGDDDEPAWSPDGQKIAFKSFRSGRTDVFAMNADGSNQVNLSKDPVWANPFSWSPDSRSIAFVSGRDATAEIYNEEIYVMNADGSGQTRLTNDPHSDNGPAWAR